MRGQVLRGQYQGQREDAGGSGWETSWRGWGHVWHVRKEELRKEVDWGNGDQSHSHCQDQDNPGP